MINYKVMFKSIVLFVISSFVQANATKATAAKANDNLCEWILYSAQVEGSIDLPEVHNALAQLNATDVARLEEFPHLPIKVQVEINRKLESLGLPVRDILLSRALNHK